MAIAYVASGAVQKVEGATSPISVPLPAGHASGHTLFLWSLADDKTGTTSTPSGWTKLGEWVPGTTTGFLVYTRLEIFYRTDTGSLGSSVSVSWSAAPWPTGDASVLVWTSAYSGCDTASPIEQVSYTTTTAPDADQLHPQMTTVAANTWLITFRAAYSYSVRTFTASGGTNSERVDDNYNNVHGALYDSNGALGAGLQTQRTTTASGLCYGGSTMLSIVLKPAAAAGSAIASPSVASAAGTAYGATVSTQTSTWSLCTPSQLPVYQAAVDWTGDGDFTDTGEDVTDDVIGDISITYGRDQDRQFSPSSVGSAAVQLINTSRKYSPEYVSSPLHGDLDPARDTRVQVTYNGTVYALFRGRIDNYDIKADFRDRTVSFTFLDGLSLLQGASLSTALYPAMRTGALINTILDLVGWTGPRSIDLGATIVRYWWAEGADALTAIQDLVRSEGPPAIAYQAPDGTFVFRDRHHRLLRTASLDVQGTFSAAAVGCSTPAATGLGFTAPFTYANGWRDIVNAVNFDVEERTADAVRSVVWTYDNTISLGIGESADLDTSGSDPFQDALTPVAGTDFTVTGGTVQVTLSRTSGASARLSFLAVGAPVVITGIQLRARAVPVTRSVKISKTDAASVSLHGAKSYPETAPWAGAQDAEAIANTVLLHYAQRRPTVQVRLVARDPSHLLQILRRTVSDRIHITNGEMGIDDDFFVERVTHTVQRMNPVGRPPVHSVVLGCEKHQELDANPFTFDLRGAGFDEGVFDPVQADNPAQVFIFDSPGQGRFDVGRFGT